MSSKKIWIIGGALVVAIGAVAYLSSNSGSAGKDAAGTIVEATRATADSPAPVATADQSATQTPAASTPDATAAAEAAKGAAGADAAAASDAADAGVGGTRGKSDSSPHA